MLPIQMANCLRAVDTPKFVMTVYGYLRMLVCIVHNLYCIPVYLLLTLILVPCYYISLAFYATIENNLYNWLLYIVSSWSFGCGLVVNEHGDDIYALVQDPSVRLLVIANHQSTADVPLIMQSFTSRSKWVLLWVMDSVFKWTNFGMVSQMHGDYFLNTRHYVSGTMFKHCTTRYSMLKNAIILFPEGGFRYKRQASSNSFAMKRNLPLLTNVTYPRYHGYHELMEPTVGVTHVVDLTICYDDIEVLPSVVDIVCGRRVSGINFHFKVFPVCDTANIASEEWLFQRWQLKDRILAGHYAAIRKTTLNQHHHNQGNGSLKRDSRNGGSAGSPASSTSSHSSVTYSSLPKSPNNSQHRSKGNDSNDGASNRSVVSNPHSNATVYDDPESFASRSNNNNNHSQVNHNNPNNNNNPNDQSQLSTSLQMFDPSQGRPIEMSWFKILAIHSFFLSINFIVYLLFILLL